MSISKRLADNPPRPGLKRRLKGMFTSVFMRYMLSYAVIMALLFISVSVYMYDYYANTIRQRIVDSSINTLSRIRYENEAQLSTLINIGSQMGGSPYIEPFRFSEEPQKSYQLRKQLILYNATTSFYERLYLVFDIDDYLYSSTTSIQIDMFLNSIMLFDGTAPEELRNLLRTHKGIRVLKSQRVESSLLDGRTQNMVTIIVPIGTSQYQSVGSLMFMVEESVYQDMFADEIERKRNTYLINEGAVIAGSRSFEIPDDVVLQYTGNRDGTYDKTVEYEGKQYLLVATAGELNDMRYCSLMPQEEITANMQSATLGFWIFLFALSVPCIFLVYYFAHRNYKPIRDIRHMFTDQGQGADDFAVIKDGIDRLVGRNVDLNSRLGESESARKSALIKDFVKCRYKDRRVCVEAAASLGLDIDKRYYKVALVGMAPGSNALSIEKLTEMLGPDFCGYGVEVLALEQILFVLFSNDAAQIDAWMKRALDACRSLGESVAVSVSNTHESFSHAATAYLEANTAYDNRFIMGSDSLLRFEDVSAAAKSTVPHMRNYLDTLKKTLRSGDSGAIDGVIDDMLTHLRGTGMSLFAFRLIYNEIISVLINEQIGQADPVDTLHIYDVFTLSNCRSIGDLDDMLRKLCRELFQKKRLDERDGAHSEIQHIVEYMNEHFTDPLLNIGAIADRFDMSAAKLSLDFKELMDMTPSDYLLLLRMEKSKELLAKTDMSIKEICAASGYYDTSGFIRRFRGYMAMTPVQYRQSKRAGK